MVFIENIINFYLIYNFKDKKEKDKEKYIG